MGVAGLQAAGDAAVDQDGRGMRTEGREKTTAAAEVENDRVTVRNTTPRL